MDVMAAVTITKARLAIHPEGNVAVFACMLDMEWERCRLCGLGWNIRISCSNQQVSQQVKQAAWHNMYSRELGSPSKNSKGRAGHDGCYNP